MSTERTFGGWLQGVAGFGERAKMLRSVQKNTTELAALTGQGSAIPSEGGFLAPKAHADRLKSRVYSTGQLLSRCAEFPMNSNRLAVPVVDETSRADGSRFGGLTMEFKPEGGQISPSKMRFGAAELHATALKGACFVTDEVARDAPALESIILRHFSLEGAFIIEDAIINGDGTSGPLGILESNARIDVAKESGQAAATIVAENLTNMFSRLWSGSQSSAVWLAHSTALPQLLDLQFGGAPAVQFSGGEPSIFGRPLLVMEQCQTVGLLGDVLLVDPAELMFADREMRFSASEHLNFTNEEWCYRMSWRIDGQPAWHSPTTPMNGSETVSPFVALAERA